MENAENLLNELKLPEFINGLKQSYEVDFDTQIHNLETIRIFQSLYRQFCFARLSLYYSYIKDERISKTEDYLQIWGKCLNLNNSILWYNSCFDLLLQAVWVNKRMYLKLTKNRDKKEIKILTTESFPKILESCTYNKFKSFIEDDSILELINQFYMNYKSIRQWANSLKHRSGIEYRQIHASEIVSLSNDVTFNTSQQIYIMKEPSDSYNSIDTLHIIDMCDVQRQLIDYHCNLYELLQKIVCTYLGIDVCLH